MAQVTGIQWTDHTFNPWWGCSKVSPGCTNCYAAALDRRVGGDNWKLNGARRFFGDEHWKAPLRWNRAAEAEQTRRRVFCASMADVFEDNPELTAIRVRLWKLVERTPSLDWQLLTKRPENIARMVPWKGQWPQNVWLGFTGEDQSHFESRYQAARRFSGLVSVLFLSAEPLLEFVDLSSGLDDLDWVIVGGESGIGSRVFNIEWAQAVLRQCRRSGVPAFVKQIGSKPMRYDSGGNAEVMRVKDWKGGDFSEWPSELRSREFPAWAPRKKRP